MRDGHGRKATHLSFYQHYRVPLNPSSTEPPSPLFPGLIFSLASQRKGVTNKILDLNSHRFSPTNRKGQFLLLRTSEEDPHPTYTYRSLHLLQIFTSPTFVPSLIISKYFPTTSPPCVISRVLGIT